MKKFCLGAIILIAGCFGPLICGAQLVDDDMFLNGHWLEVCVAPNGSWGNTVAPPASYVTHSGGSTYYTDPVTGTSYSGSNDVDFIYNTGHGGWTVSGPSGTPIWGPYFLPGTPFDGWAVQVNGIMGQAFYTTTGFTSLGAVDFGGTNTTYETSISTGGCLSPNTKAGIWKGYFIPEGSDTLQIIQENRVDTGASWDVVTIKFKNKSATAMTGLYYLVTADPDNDEPYPGGSFPTNNLVVHQNDYRHRVMVQAVPPSIDQDAYTSLCTRDCRAQSMIYEWWPPSLSAGNDLDLVASHTATGMGTCYYTVGSVTLSQDIAYGLIYTLGNLPAGDSAILSFAWNFKDSTCTDSAFPDPVLVVDGVIRPRVDTFNACGLGMSNLPVCLGYADDKDWSWANWTWSPATGLSASTGVSQNINLLVIPGTVTYTITGNDSTFGMHSCNTYQMFLTVNTCNHIWATANYPCQGDSIIISGHSDSSGAIGATYVWSKITGVATGFTSTLLSPTIYPAVYPDDTGRYMVIRTNPSGMDTAYVTIHIHPNPVASTNNNSDSLCASSTVDTMKLYCYPSYHGDSYLWSGPGGFSSTLPDPRVNTYTIADTGIYTVIVTDSVGCQSTFTTDAIIIDTVPYPRISDDTFYCTGSTFIPFGISIRTGATALWYADSVGGVGSHTAPTVDLSYVHSETVYASQIQGFCEGPRTSFTVVVDSTPPAPFVSSNSPLCSDSVLYLTSTNPLDSGTFSWSGPAGFSSILQNPVITNAQVANQGDYTVVYSVHYHGITCSSTHDTTVVINQSPATPGTLFDTACNGSTMNLYVSNSTYSSSYVYQWVGPAGYNQTTSANMVTNAAVLGATNGVYAVQAIMLGTPTCKSPWDSILVTIWPNPDSPITKNFAYCQGYMYPERLWADDHEDTAVNRYYNYLTWYNSPTSTVSIDTTIPPSTAIGMPQIYYVTQSTVHSTTVCVSPRSMEVINILDTPEVRVSLSSPFACQDSSVTLASTGMDYINPTFRWTSPAGSTVVYDTSNNQVLTITLDSLYDDTISSFVYNTEFGITCMSHKQVSIHVVPMPSANCYAIPLVCVGDTVNVELTNRSDNAASFVWELGFEGTDGYVYSSSGNGGGFGVHWDEGGYRLITVIPYTVEGCRGLSTYDTVLVVERPSASFNHGVGGTVCSSDSVLFKADIDSATYTYNWQPAHFFNQDFGSAAWGRVEVSGYVTLNVTDAYGCHNSDSVYYNTDPHCCSVWFPDAFTPNGDNKNDFFRPKFFGNGYHKFHTFTIMNRWGQIVFTASDDNSEWDGNFGGVPQDIGVYYYYLKYDCDGKTREASGDVTLIR